jgi:hypothetical protein
MFATVMKFLGIRLAIVGLATAIRITQTGAAPNGELWAVQPVRIFHVLGPAAGR